MSHCADAALLVQEIDDLGNCLLLEGLKARNKHLGFLVVAGHQVHEEDAVALGELLVLVGVLFEVAAESERKCEFTF